VKKYVKAEIQDNKFFARWESEEDRIARCIVCGETMHVNASCYSNCMEIRMVCLNVNCPQFRQRYEADVDHDDFCKI
jgi:hypothetical protein